MRTLSLFLFFALGAGLAAKPSTAKVATGTLEGTVIDSHGKALSGATVMIQTSDGQHPHATRTDANGRFAFVRFEVGQYDVRAYLNGSYSEWAKRIVIRTTKPNSITLRIGATKS
jgi:protocatechuate 3,4-dioxygenase beta subunit